MGVKKQHEFDPNTFLATVGEGRKFVLFPKNYGIFAQEDTADAVFYVQTGKVKLTVVSKTRKEATVGILGEGDFQDGALNIWTLSFASGNTADIRGVNS